MRRYIPLFAATCLVLQLATSPAFAGEAAPVAADRFETPIKLACIGDSITYGSGIEEREQNHYPARLQEMLGSDWSVRNFGVSGATLLEKGNKPYIEQPEYREALRWEPEVVVIMLGTNDSKPVNWDAHADAYVADYRALVSSFQGANPDARIFVVLPVPAFPGEWGIRDKIIRQQIIPRVREVATAEAVSTIDLYSPLEEEGELFPDTVHPNAKGADLMARHIHGVLTGQTAGAQ